MRLLLTVEDGEDSEWRLASERRIFSGMRYLILIVALSGCLASSGVVGSETVAILHSSSVTYDCAGTEGVVPGRCGTRKEFYLESSSGKVCRVSEKEYWQAKRDSTFTCRWKAAQ